MVYKLRTRPDLYACVVQTGTEGIQSPFQFAACRSRRNDRRTIKIETRYNKWLGSNILFLISVFHCNGFQKYMDVKDRDLNSFITSVLIWQEFVISGFYESVSTNYACVYGWALFVRILEKKTPGYFNISIYLIIILQIIRRLTRT